MKYFILIFIYLSSSFGDNLTNKIDKLVKNQGKKKLIILKYNPFIYKYPKKIVTKNRTIFSKKRRVIHRLKLTAIMNNRAFINNHWLIRGNKINGYRVKKIYPNRVVLRKNRRTTILKFREKKILKIGKLVKI